MWDRMVVSVSVVHPHDDVDDWELAQCHEQIIVHVSLAQEKSKIKISKYGFY